MKSGGSPDRHALTRDLRLISWNKLNADSGMDVIHEKIRDNVSEVCKSEPGEVMDKSIPENSHRGASVGSGGQRQ
jgi:hypothetical protein